MKTWTLARVFLALASVAGMFPGTASAQSAYHVVHRFNGPTEGSAPQGTLIQGTDGNLYGTTASGGGGNAGTVFRATLEGTVTVLHAFTGSPDGAEPQGALVQASDGNFYGTTFKGGSANSGTVFRMTQNGDVSILYSFSGGAEGSSPGPVVLQARDGNLYGNTVVGGSSNLGTVFRLSLSGNMTVVHTFGVHGGGDLIEASTGDLYGIGGGASRAGTIFKLTPAGVFTVMHEFADHPFNESGGDGVRPRQLVQASDGNLYGVTTGESLINGYCCSYFFRMTLAGQFDRLGGVLIDSSGPLVEGLDGNFYATSTDFFVPSRSGNIYQVTPSGIVKTVATLVLNNCTPGTAMGYDPRGLLRVPGGALYVLTASETGGVGCSAGGAGTIARFGPFPDMSIEQPAAGRRPQPFTLSGFAVDPDAASGTGVDELHVWAFPSIGPAQFAGVAQYGQSRPAVGTAYGSRFTSSGYSLSVSGLSPGRYTLRVSAHSTASGTFNQERFLQVTILAPDPWLQLDAPANGTAVDARFSVGGWALDSAAASGSGIDTIHIWAFPVDGGGPVFVGVPDIGRPRPDVAVIFGGQFVNSGFRLDNATLPPGRYQLVVYAHSAVTNAFDITRSADITVAAPVPSPVMSIDGPTPGPPLEQPFRIGGWAADLGATTGPGVDAIHVWAFPVGGGSPTFAGVATYGQPRADVGAVFGAQFTNSGYNLDVSGLTVGTYDIGVYVHSAVSGTFNQVKFVRVTILQ